jgi:hypothetical protein
VELGERVPDEWIGRSRNVSLASAFTLRMMAEEAKREARADLRNAQAASERVGGAARERSDRLPVPLKALAVARYTWTLGASW